MSFLRAGMLGNSKSMKQYLIHNYTIASFTKQSNNKTEESLKID